MRRLWIVAALVAALSACGSPDELSQAEGRELELARDRIVAAAELTWQAGPLAKGPGLCHGTAGNGYALLAMHARTGDAKWALKAHLRASPIRHALCRARSSDLLSA